MNAGDRFKGWIDDTFTGWSDRMATWGLGVLGRGIVKALEDQEPGIIDQVQANIQQIIDNPNTPEITRTMLGKSIQQGNIFQVAMGWVLSVIGLIPALFALGGPIGNIFNHSQELALRSQLLDPIQAITAWRRDPEKYAKMLDDLKYGGWDDDRIEAIKFATLFYPGAPDLVSWQAREVFEPDMIAKYGLDDELGGIDREPFYKAGMTDEQITNYWRAHWEHASWMQIVEMLHRGLVTEEDVYDWFRVVEIVPHWRDLLIQTAYTWPTRVDVRRWWDMRTIDEARLRELYAGMGYRGENLEDYIRWTKVYVDFPYWLSRWQKGWVNEEEVREWLRSVGIPEDRIDIFIQDKIKPEEGARVEEGKALTKSEIYKGVKQGKISRDQAIELLVDLDYGRDEADYLLAINIPEDETDEVVEERKLSKSDIKTALAQGIITEAEARAKLQELRYSAANVDLLIKIFNAANNPPEEEQQRQASKADIVAGVKKGVITSEEGYVMLTDIGFSPEAANFILTVKAEESPFSPVDFTEYQSLLSKYKRATGREAPEMPEELKAAAAEVVRVSGEVDAIRQALVEEERKLVDQDIIPEEAAARKKEIQASLRKAEAELSRVKTNYERLVAEWKHSLA